jgi:antitoxin YefM
MKDISTYIPISKAKTDLLNIIRRLESLDDAVAVTKNGVPAGVILSVEKYEGLLETLDILSDEKTMGSLRTSMCQARRGK